MLRMEEVVSLTFEHMNHLLTAEEWFDVSLPPRKASQTGTRGTWRLWANDAKASLCPKRAQLSLAKLYGHTVERKGPLFRQVDSSGAILANSPMVSYLP